jgi:hypothetical protein
VTDAEYIKLLLRQAYTSQHKAVAAHSLYRIDTHTAHHFFNLMRPCGDEINEAFGAYFGIEPFDQLGSLRRYTPVAFAYLTGAA